MPEKPQKIRKKEKLAEKESAESDSIAPNAWSRDQQQKSYYYDDSHGYEIYRPDEDDEEDEI